VQDELDAAVRCARLGARALDAGARWAIAHDLDAVGLNAALHQGGLGALGALLRKAPSCPRSRFPTNTPTAPPTRSMLPSRAPYSVRAGRSSTPS